MSEGTLYDKVWDRHRVATLPTGQDQLFVGLHLVHEVTSPQAFGMIAERDMDVAYPERTHATVDHIVPTDNRDRPFADDVHVTGYMPEKRQKVAEGSAEGLLSFKNSNTDVAKTFMRYMFTQENLIDFLVNLSPVHNIPAWTSIATSDNYRSRLKETEAGKGWSEEDLNNYQVEGVKYLQHKTMEGGTNDQPNPYPSIYYSEPIWNLQSDVLLEDKNPEDVIDQRAQELQAQLDDVQG